VRQARVDNRHIKRFAQPLPERDRQRQAGKAGAADNQVRPRTCEIAFIHAYSL
jgi:hypothetical protein